MGQMIILGNHRSHRPSTSSSDSWDSPIGTTSRSYTVGVINALREAVDGKLCSAENYSTNYGRR
jgi:hypothetical protein